MLNIVKKEHLRSEETEDTGTFVVRVDDGRKKKKKEKGGDGRRVCLAVAREERRGFIPVAPAKARPRGLGVHQVDNTMIPPRDVRWGGLRGLKGCGRGEEDARTDGAATTM